MIDRTVSLAATPGRRPANCLALVLLVLLGMALSACARNGGDYVQELHALGTLITLTVYDTDEATAEAAGAELERLYVSLGRDWYPWYEGRRGGELSRINAALARGETVEVSPPLAELLQRAAEIEIRSGGLFNVALGGLTELWGFNKPLQTGWQPPPPAAVAALMAERPGSERLHWDGLRLSSDSRDLVIDPGGIAKGAILALSMDVLRRHGIANAIVDLGGDMSIRGTVHGRSARIGIRNPEGGPPAGWLEAKSGETVVTSGNYERFFAYDGKRYAHIIDPGTGAPAGGTASVTVIHEDAVLADAAATALLVAGSYGFDATCQALGIRFAVLVDSSGDLSLTSAMRERVHWSGDDAAEVTLRH